MKNKARIFMIIETILLSITLYSCKVENKLPFNINNGKKASFRTIDGDVVRCEIPNGYKQDGIRIYKGDRTTLLIPYADSSLFYICTDIYNNPNRNNIEGLHTAASSWRIHFEMLYAIKEQGIPDELKQKTYTECNCTYSDLLDYQAPEIVDFYGEGEGYIWRDVLKNGVCMGYIIKDTTKVKSFNQCIESSIYKLPKRITSVY